MKNQDAAGTEDSAKVVARTLACGWLVFLWLKGWKVVAASTFI